MSGAPTKREAPDAVPSAGGQTAAHELNLGCESGGAAHAGPAQPAVAVGHLVQVLLVVGLGVVEGTGWRDFGGDVAVAGVLQPRGELVARGLGRRLLLGAVVVERRAVLRAHVVALAVALGRVVVLPEDLEDLLTGDLLGVE